jgi:hypothetical protein
MTAKTCQTDDQHHQAFSSLQHFCEILKKLGKRYQTVHFLGECHERAFIDKSNTIKQPSTRLRELLLGNEHDKHLGTTAKCSRACWNRPPHNPKFRLTLALPQFDVFA